MKALLLATLALFGALEYAPAHSAQTYDSIRYDKLLDYQRRIDALKDLTQVRIEALIHSTLPEVTPAEIRLTVQRDSGGAISVPLDAKGHFTLPIFADLQKQNPLVVSNQPDDTLEIDVNINIVAPHQTTMSYADFVLGPQEFNEAIHRQGILASLFGPKARGITLLYYQGNHTLTLHRGNGNDLVKSVTIAEAASYLKGINLHKEPATASVIHLEIDGDLLKENPEVVLDALPDEAYPSF